MAAPAKTDEEGGDFVSKRAGYMIQAIQGKLPDNARKNFGKLKSDSDRFVYVWKLPETHEVILLEPEYTMKHAENAKKHRERGNEYFQKKSYLTALGEYNVSVMCAPDCNAPLQTWESPAVPNGDATVPGEKKENSEPNSAPTGKVKDSADSKGEEKKGKEMLNEKDEEGKSAAPADRKKELALAYANRCANRVSYVYSSSKHK